MAGVDKGEGEVDEVGTNVGRVRGVEGAEVSESKEAWEGAGEGRVAEGAQPMGKPWAAKALTKASQLELEGDLPRIDSSDVHGHV